MVSYTPDEFLLQAYRAVRDYRRVRSVFGYAQLGHFAAPSTATYGEMWVLNAIDRLGLEFLDRIESYTRAMSVHDDGMCDKDSVLEYMASQTEPLSAPTFIIPVRAEMLDPGNMKAMWRLYDDLGLYYYRDHDVTPDAEGAVSTMAYRSLSSMLDTLLPRVWSEFTEQMRNSF